TRRKKALRNLCRILPLSAGRDERSLRPWLPGSWPHDSVSDDSVSPLRCSAPRLIENQKSKIPKAIIHHPSSITFPALTANGQPSLPPSLGSLHSFPNAAASGSSGFCPVLFMYRFVADHVLKYPSNCSRSHCVSIRNGGGTISSNGNEMLR